MKDFCSKFRNSILILTALIMYLLCALLFFLLFSIDNPEIIDLSRTAAVTLSTYFLFMLLLSVIYGRYDVRKRKEKETVFSLTVTHILTDLVTYFELTIMKTNDANNRSFTIENVGILFLVFILQIFVIIVFTKLGGKFCLWIFDKEKCLVITKDIKAGERIKDALSAFDNRYTVNGIISYESGELEKEMLKADTVVLYEVPVGIRTEISDFCYQNLKNFYFNPHIADILEQNSRPAALDDISFFTWDFHLISFEERIIKKLMDIVISVLLIILLSPILIISAVCIKKYDGGSILFKQKRATANGRIFEIYKFRTMREHVENRSVTKDDDRVTRPGRILRKYRIDELPQLFNILKGDMSLVGPRPEMLENVEDYERSLPEFRYRLRMKAGLTGYAQIYGKYNTSSQDKLMLDIMYIENYSIFKDIQILFQTIMVLFKAEDSTEAFSDKDPGKNGG
ncbi:MAG: exopolysaccharide biosynthesis polyprenyl glycosylphosphotransferase [Lachnospiraceae bacterium]|nr:exopolysaccharide biosynthesis polyprenyl glycosylphosphotransferase [Lachnospiraceae bacterium]